MTKFVIRIACVIPLSVLTLIFVIRTLYYLPERTTEPPGPYRVVKETSETNRLASTYSTSETNRQASTYSTSETNRKASTYSTSESNRKASTYLREAEISTGNNINDTLTWANSSFSKMTFSQKRSSYSLGEEIHVVITLYDGYGNRRTKGGEYLRLWMWNDQLQASVSGKVFDYNNGTFIGILKAVWSGSATIGAFIARRREEIAYYYEILKKYHSIRGVRAEFTRGNLKEESICSALPLGIKTGSRTWCNLTNDNSGFSWYCLKPLSNNLTCDTWTTSWSIHYAFSGDILKRFNDRKWTGLRGLPLVIKGKNPVTTHQSVDCSKVLPEVTWEWTPPNGFFYKDKWQSTLCTDTLPRSTQAYSQCLKGRTLYLHGDSTSRQFSEALHRMYLLTPPKGHNPYVRHFPNHNFSISWHAHELPFYHGGIHYNKSTNQAQHVLLDSLPNSTKDIIVLYLYVHFTLNHPDVFRRHVQKLVQSTRKLLARAPNVTVAVRGPHAFYTADLLLSYWGLEYMDILHEEFAILRERVVYLDYWDLTVARLFRGSHAPSKTVECMVHYMMSLLCHRTNN